MFRCPCKMNEYLSTIINKYVSNKFTKLNIVIGNESCDLDSAICSIVYATYLNWLEEKSGKNYENENCITISVLDVGRNDLPLKTEVAFSLKECGISESSLIFRDDVTLERLIKSGNTTITLVDHHVLSKRLDFLTPYVVEIIDHRPLDPCWKLDNVKSFIKIVGSCATLVGQKIKDGIDGFFDVFPMCADLLHSVIILDTVNFSKEVNKATPLDEDIVVYLESVLKLENCQETRKTKLSRLLEARSDVTALTSSQLLRKDSKIVGDIFVPSFPILVKDFLKQPGALQAVIEVLKSNKCAIAVLLGMDLKDGLKRDTAIICPLSPERGEELANFLQYWKNPCLQLERENNLFIYFKQLNLGASRKQYMPALNEFLQNCKE